MVDLLDAGPRYVRVEPNRTVHIVDMDPNEHVHNWEAYCGAKVWRTDILEVLITRPAVFCWKCELARRKRGVVDAMEKFQSNNG